MSEGAWVVERAIAEPMPNDVDPTDAEAVARFVASSLRKAGFGSGAGVATLDREQATVRRMELPTVEDAEFPDMARLAVQHDAVGSRASWSPIS